MAAGRGRVKLRPGHATASQRTRIEEIAHALGYHGVRLVHERDDGPRARRRLRAGGPLLPAVEPPEPPPPPPPAAQGPR
ncbi:hypothetical protein [Streptomyces vilmorinianum]|uniref:hypothetical protein n=1 Tax=Streptomyces vilmorinianum TaxID=3051092 RepID=UPI0010FAE049|nr:hypothetical protein [Streptomyces vilmorinianum]